MGLFTSDPLARLVSTPTPPEHAISPDDVFGRPAPDTLPALTRRERNAVIARIHALMEYWGITVDDLSGDTPLPPAAVPATPPAIKYRHPVTGDTWDGQGPHPDWLRRALLHEGLRVDELKPG
jgi:DNA-binding protein H-NS